MLPATILSFAAWIVATNAAIIGPRNTDDCPIICIDKINECGIKYGAVFLFVLESHSQHLASPLAQLRHQLNVQLFVSTKSTECGIKYGGCVPSCPGKPFPTFSKPACPTATQPYPMPNYLHWQSQRVRHQIRWLRSSLPWKATSHILETGVCDLYTYPFALPHSLRRLG